MGILRLLVAYETNDRRETLILLVFVGVPRADDDVVPAGLDHPARQRPPEVAAPDDGDRLAAAIAAHFDGDAVAAAAAARLLRAAAASATRLAPDLICGFN